MCKATSNRVSWTWTGQFRCQGRLAGAVEGRRQSGRERFGEMAIVLFIGGHSCGAGAEDGMAIHRRLQSMIALATVNGQSSFALYKAEHLRGLMDENQYEGGRMARGLENIQARLGLGQCSPQRRGIPGVMFLRVSILLLRDRLMEALLRKCS